MAIKPLKSIKFPELPDTYTIPQVDSTPTQGSSNAVSSGGVWDEISDLKDDFAQYTGASASLNIDMFEHGSIANGEDSTYRKNARARSKTKVTASFEFTLSVFNDPDASTDFAFSVYSYDAGGSSQGGSQWIKEGSSYTVSIGQTYRILIADMHRQAASDVVDVSELVGHIRVESKFREDMLQVLSATTSTNTITLTEGQDLTVLPTGSYVCTSAEVAETLINCPVENNFRLFVIERINAYNKTSILICNHDIYMRHGSSSAEYASWYKVINNEDLKEVHDKIDDAEYELERSLNDVKPNAYRYEKGSINSEGNNSDFQSYKRARSINVEEALYDMSIKSDDSDYQHSIFYYNDAGEYAYSTGWAYAATIIPYGSHFRLLFANLNTSQTTPVDLDTILSHYTFSRVSTTDVVSKNSKVAEALMSLKRHVHDLRGGSGARRLNHNNLFCIAHISDIHLDTTRYGNFIKFCDKYFDLIDCKICTGDFVNDPTDEQIAHMRDYETVKTVLWCDGNHERHGTVTGLTRQQVYEKWGLATWYQETNVVVPSGYTADSGREDYQGVFDYPLYYYKDYADADSVSGYNIRLIVLNCCDARTDISKSSQLPSYTTEQIKWFVDVLQDAAVNGYAVIVAQHYMESIIAPGENTSFYTRDNMDEPETLNPANGDITVVENIIDAFRKGESYVANNILVRPSDTGNMKLSVNADFSGNPGQFLAWMVGHSHRDRIGYSKNHPDQLILQVVDGSFQSTLASVVNQDMSNVSDLPRVEGKKSEDAFNIYAFDPVNKLCKVLRVGSDLNDMMIPREYACFETEPIIT